MSITQPLQPRLRLMRGLGMALLMISVVGVAFRSWAESPGAHPGNPPAGVQTAPLVSVQLPIGGGAEEVTLETVGTQIANAVAVPRRAMARSVKADEVRIVRSLRRSTVVI